MFPVDLPFIEQPLAWVRDKCRVRQFADNKNRPGIDYPSKIEDKHQKHEPGLAIVIRNGLYYLELFDDKGKVIRSKVADSLEVSVYGTDEQRKAYGCPKDNPFVGLYDKDMYDDEPETAA